MKYNLNESIILSLFDCENFFAEEFSSRFFKLLPQEDNNGDVLHRCGRLLLRYMLIKNEIMSKEDALSAKLSPGKFGKPCFTNGKINFSISHSGRLVGCAISRNNVGFDIQLRESDAEKSVKLASRFFSQAEQNMIKNSDDVEKAFHLIWSKKEALIKYYGIAFENSEITDTALLPNKLCFFSGFMSQENEKYAFSLCCEKGISVAQPRFVMPGDILSVLGNG